MLFCPTAVTMHTPAVLLSPTEGRLQSQSTAAAAELATMHGSLFFRCRPGRRCQPVSLTMHSQRIVPEAKHAVAAEFGAVQPERW
jgi:hypothetical protein